MGRMRSGKDTVAQRLVSAHQFTRLAFADPLKGHLTALDPWITRNSSTGAALVRLSALVEYVGWERAKDDYPEVRRLLQRAGEGIRMLDPDFWVRQLLAKVDNADRWGLPVVVADVRYRNEAEALSARGFRMVRVIRPNVAYDTPASQHGSERALDHWTPDTLILNAFSVDELHRRTDALLA
jgi:hypothetical protein